MLGRCSLAAIFLPPHLSQYFAILSSTVQPSYYINTQPSIFRSSSIVLLGRRLRYPSLHPLSRVALEKALSHRSTSPSLAVSTKMAASFPVPSRSSYSHPCLGSYHMLEIQHSCSLCPSRCAFLSSTFSPCRNLGGSLALNSSFQYFASISSGHFETEGGQCDLPAYQRDAAP